MSFQKVSYIAIVFFFFCGLYKISEPPLDRHSWRQAFTIGVSKEFVNHPNVFFPRTIIGGELNIVASVFPFYNYLLYVFYKILGYDHWYGRLLSWCIACIGYIFFFLLLRKFYTEKISFLAMLSLMFSITSTFARKSMPDVFCLSVGMIGLFYISTYLEKGRIWQMLLGIALLLVCVLNKLPFVNLFPFLLFPILKFEYPIKRLYLTLTLLGVVLIAAFLWYFLWLPFLLERYKNPLFFPYSFIDGFVAFAKNIDTFLLHLSKLTFYNYITFLISIYGIFIFAKREKGVNIFLFSYVAIFFLFGIKSGNVMPTHDYYLIPILPLLSLSAGYAYGILKIKPVYLYSFFVLNLLPSVMKLYKETLSLESKMYYLNFSKVCNEYIPKDSLILVNGGQLNPELMFWTSRRGWSLDNNSFQKTEWLADYKKKGMTYMVQDKILLSTKLNLPVIFENDFLIIYKP
ncbi:MAG: hypothetical protein RLZZ546_1237 [Bacteroidota bacterium]|jgi:4-amino-4-deoxy-L-arabinose transferase-like glycosyltransferase